MTDPIRVLWLSKGLGIGGIERILCWTAARRDRSRIDCRVAYVLTGLDALADELRSLDVPVTDLGARNEFDLRWARRLRDLVCAERIDVVHAHSPYAASIARLVTRSLPRAQRPKLVSTDHNVWGDYSRLTRAAYRLTFRLDDANLAVSAEVRHSVPRRWRSRVEVSVPGIPIRELLAHAGNRASERAALEVSDDDVLILTVANYRAPKRYPDLIRAAKIVVDRGLPARFVAIGQGPMEPSLRQLVAELGLEDTFRLVGLREDAVHVLPAADAFALASHHEGGPLAILEAMIFGKPVIATPVGIVPDVIRDGQEGRVVPVGRVDLLADALCDVIADPEGRRVMGAAAAARASAFDIGHFVERMQDLYEAIAVRHREGGR